MVTIITSFFLSNITILKQLFINICLSYLIVNFKPLQLLIDYITIRYDNIFILMLSLLFTCFFCISFWLNLIFIDIYVAAICFTIFNIINDLSKKIGKKNI